MPRSMYGESGPEKISAAYESDSTTTRTSATSPVTTVATMPPGASSPMNRLAEGSVIVKRMLPWRDCSPEPEDKVWICLTSGTPLAGGERRDEDSSARTLGG